MVEIEGEKDFVEGLLAKIFPLLEEAGFGSRPPSASIEPVSESPEAAQQTGTPEEEAGKGKAKKRRVSTPPKGHSCADRILSLKSENFFKDHRSVGEIVEGLKGKGWTHKPNQVGAALTNMFGRHEIQRTKEGNGSWKYFWDRG